MTEPMLIPTKPEPRCDVTGVPKSKCPWCSKSKWRFPKLSMQQWIKRESSLGAK